MKARHGENQVRRRFATSWAAPATPMARRLRERPPRPSAAAARSLPGEAGARRGSPHEPEATEASARRARSARSSPRARAPRRRYPKRTAPARPANDSRRSADAAAERCLCRKSAAYRLPPPRRLRKGRGAKTGAASSMHDQRSDLRHIIHRVAQAFPSEPTILDSPVRHVLHAKRWHLVHEHSTDFELLVRAQREG
jgi:hypothetical protein